MENNSPEKIENQPYINVEKITFLQKMSAVLNNPKAKEGIVAIVRTAINTLGVVADFWPWAGEAFEALVILGKKIPKDNQGRRFDLLPDVPTWLVVLANAGEIPTGGVFPSYAIPAGWQFSKDRPRIIEGYEQAKTILQNEKNDYHQNQPQINNAIEVFTNK